MGEYPAARAHEAHPYESPFSLDSCPCEVLDRQVSYFISAVRVTSVVTRADTGGLPLPYTYIIYIPHGQCWHGMPCPYQRIYQRISYTVSNCDILSSQTRWQSIGHPPESSPLAERLQAPAECLRPHSPAPPNGAWLR